MSMILPWNITATYFLLCWNFGIVREEIQDLLTGEGTLPLMTALSETKKIVDCTASTFCICYLIIL